MKNILIIVLAVICLRGYSEILSYSNFVEYTKSGITKESMLKQNIERVDKSIEFMNKGTPTYNECLKILITGKTIERFAISNIAEKYGYDHKPTYIQKSIAVKGVLGYERYKHLENALFKQVQSSDGESRTYAVQVLAKNLGSDVAKDYMKKTMNHCLNALALGNELPVSVNEFFACGEGLAYLNDDSSVYVLQSVMESSKSIPSFKQRAIEAANFLDSKELLASVEGLLTSKESRVARDAFDSFNEYNPNKQFVVATTDQWNRLSRKYNDTSLLTNDDNVLLAGLANISSKLYENDKFSVYQKANIRTATYTLIQSDNWKTKYWSAAMLTSFVTDDDISIVDKLLKSDNAMIRREGLISLSKCSPALIIERKDVLISMLDSDNQTERFYSLWVLTTGLGEVSANMFTDKQFEEQKKRVLKVYKDMGINNKDKSQNTDI